MQLDVYYEATYLIIKELEFCYLFQPDLRLAFNIHRSKVE